MKFAGSTMTPDEERQLEAECYQVSVLADAAQDAAFDDYMSELVERDWRAERARMLAEGKMLTYEQALALSKKYYNHGGDLFVECVGPEDYEPCTLEEMLDSYDLERERWNQAQWDDSTKIWGMPK
jgi:hypothetical protein